MSKTNNAVYTWEDALESKLPTNHCPKLEMTSTGREWRESEKLENIMPTTLSANDQNSHHYLS